MESAFKNHWPSQTSSPLVGVSAVKDANELQKKRDGVKPSAVNGCDNGEKGDARKEPAATQKPQRNVQVTQK